MYHSLLHFIENDITEIENLVGDIIQGNKDSVDLSLTIQDKLNNLGTKMISEIYELIDKEIFESISRKKKYYVEHKNEHREILDVMGTLSFNRRGYVSKSGGKNIYLLDDILGLDGHQRITLASAAKALEEAVETSYEKGGKKASENGDVSKMTVKNWIHKTEIDYPNKKINKKKKIKTLHIVADEDHVAAQFLNKKGDLKTNSVGRKINTIMPKIIVVYENVVDDAPEGSKNHRFKLIGKKIFSGVYSGETENYKFWQMVQDYIDSTYDFDYLERVYIAGDGAGWIRSGTDVVEKSKFVIDKFHLMKYINRSVTHLLNEDEVKAEIWRCINGTYKNELKNQYQEILKVTENPNKYEEVQKSITYFIHNWDGIEIRKTDKDEMLRCCAEAQVSHILSDRLSSRPLGWSVKGCDHMAKLRAYTRNGGSIINLLKYQKQEQEKELRRQEQEELIRELRQRQSNWKYNEMLQCQIPGLENKSLKWLKSLLNSELLG